MTRVNQVTSCPSQLCCCCCCQSLQSCRVYGVDSVRPHRCNTRLPRPWDSPRKNTGVGSHFLLQCMKVKSESEVAQLSPTLSNPKEHSLPGSSIHRIFQAKVLEWGAIAFPLLVLTFYNSVITQSLTKCQFNSITSLYFRYDIHMPNNKQMQSSTQT